MRNYVTQISIIFVDRAKDGVFGRKADALTKDLGKSTFAAGHFLEVIS